MKRGEGMEKSNRSIVIALMIILIVVVCVGGYYIFNLNNKIEKQNATIEDLKSENLNSKSVIEEMKKDNKKIDSVTMNAENINSKSTEDIIKELFLAKLSEINKNNSEKLQDYKIDKIEVVSNKLNNKYTQNDILAMVTYSVKPNNINSTLWIAGNGEIKDEWIINKISCECLRDGKLLNTTGFDTSF